MADPPIGTRPLLVALAAALAQAALLYPRSQAIHRRSERLPTVSLLALAGFSGTLVVAYLCGAVERALCDSAGMRVAFTAGLLGIAGLPLFRPRASVHGAASPRRKDVILAVGLSSLALHLGLGQIVVWLTGEPLLGWEWHVLPLLPALLPALGQRMGPAVRRGEVPAATAREPGPIPSEPPRRPELGPAQEVLGRDEERRRLRRDIHDGLGPTLASIGMRVEIARLLLDRADMPGTQRVLAVLAEAHRDAVADLRRLVEGLGPLALDRLGLVRAVERHVRNLAPPDVDGPTMPRPPEFTVQVGDDLGELPSAVEIAAFRICMEATTNVMRHAHATRCTIDLRRQDDHLSIRIEDDGRGLAPDHRIGIGLLSIYDRTAELGGTCAVTGSESGGTLVHTLLPVDPFSECPGCPDGNPESTGAPVP